MKKFMQVCGIIASVLIIVGLVMAIGAGSVVGMSSVSDILEDVTDGKVNFDTGIFEDWGRTFPEFPAIAPVESVEAPVGVESVGSVTNTGYEFDESTVFDKNYDIVKGDVAKYLLGEKVEKIVLALGGCDFETKQSVDDNFYVEAQGANKFQSYVESGTLYVRGTVGSVIWGETQTFKVILYVPANYICKEINMEVGAGTVVYDGLNAEKVNAKVGAGFLNLKNVTAQELVLSVGAGRMETANVAVDTLSVDVGLGDCVLEGKIEKRADVECAMGNVDLKVKGNEKDFNYILECAMGNVDLGKNSYSGVSNDHTITNGADKDMNIECAMGNVTIKFVN